MINKFFTPLLLSFALICFQGNAIAADNKEDKAPVYEGNYKLIESYGIYTKPKDGSLGRDLWSNTPRSAIEYWIKESPNFYTNPIVQKLMFGALLSKVNARLIKDDVPVTPGADLLTLRLEKLIKMGSYPQASELYALAEDEAYHPTLAYNGILAMLYAGNKSIACLEVKVSLEKFATDKKLIEISHYCDLGSNKDAHKAAKKALSKSDHAVLKTISRNKKYRVGYSVERYSAYSPLEQAVLVADGRVSVAPLGKINVESIPPQHLLFLLHNDKISERERFALTQRAVYWGLLRAEALETLYEEAEIPEDGAPSWLQLAALYQKANNMKGEERWAVLSQAFSLGRKQGLHLLTPFAKAVRIARPKEASLNDIETALSVLVTAGEEVEQNWLTLVEKLNTDNKPQYNSVLTALYAAAPRYKRKDSLESTAKDIISKANQGSNKNRTLGVLAAILENSRAAGAKNNADSGIYEKTFLLTSPGNYVMPTYQVWNRLNHASQKGSIGETVLLSSNILRIYAPEGRSGNNIGTIYPGLLRDMLRSLDNVGLTNVSKDLSIQVALEQK